MNLNLKFFTLVIFFFSSLRVVYSQSDFREALIIRNNNDTLFGLVHYGTPINNSKVCYYRKDSISPVIKFYPENIKKYIFKDNKQYVSKALPNDSGLLFFEYLVDGTLDLYFLARKEKSFYYIEKDGQLYALTKEKKIIERDGEDYTATSNKYIGVLKLLMQDADLSMSRIDKTNYNHQGLIEITKDYHNAVCDTVQCIVYYRSEKKVNNTRWQVHVGVTFGGAWNTLEMRNEIQPSGAIVDGNLILNYFQLEESEINREADGLYPGLFVCLRGASHYSFQFEGQYQISKYQNIEFKNLYFPVIFNYEFLYLKKTRPYINIGFEGNYMLQPNFNNFRVNFLERIPDNELNHSEYLEGENMSLKKFNFGLLAGCGVQRNLSDKCILKFEVRQLITRRKLTTKLSNAPEFISYSVFSHLTSALSLSYCIN